MEQNEKKKPHLFETNGNKYFNEQEGLTYTGLVYCHRTGAFCKVIHMLGSLSSSVLSSSSDKYLAFSFTSLL